MRAVVTTATGDADVLDVADVPEPTPSEHEVLIRVAAAGVNRADVLQRMGFYPPPPGASAILGLEVSGDVIATGSAVTRWKPGDRVMALLEGGGYAEVVAVAETQVMPVGRLLILDAGGVPEVFITAHDSLFTRARLRPGETVLIHGGAGGVGTAAIQLAKRHGCRVAVTAGSESRLERCSELGAEILIDHRTDDFVEVVRAATEGHGADVVLDVMGGSYLQRNVDVLATDARLIVIGMQGGTYSDIDLAALSRRRATIVAPHLRGRPREQKAGIVAAFSSDALPALAQGSIRPVVGAVFPLARVADAHRAMESQTVVGKILLDVAA